MTDDQANAPAEPPVAVPEAQSVPESQTPPAPNPEIVDAVKHAELYDPIAYAHQLKVVDTPGQRFKYLVECKCGWQGRTSSLEEVDLFKVRHLEGKYRANASI